MKTNTHFWSYPSYFFLEWEMFQTKVVKEIKTHFYFSIFFKKKLYHLWDNVVKYCGAAQTTDENMAHVLCMLDT